MMIKVIVQATNCFIIPNLNMPPLLLMYPPPALYLRHLDYHHRLILSFSMQHSDCAVTLRIHCLFTCAINLHQVIEFIVPCYSFAAPPSIHAVACFLCSILAFLPFLLGLFPAAAHLVVVLFGSLDAVVPLAEMP